MKSKNQKDVKITFWGVRGSIPTPGPNTVKYGGNTSCVSIEYNGQYIILDAGTGIREFGNYLLRQGKYTGNKMNIFISHTHWDHIQGLPFLASAFIKGNSIRIYGPKLFNQKFKKIVSNQMEYIYFPIRLEDLDADISFHEIGLGTYKGLIDGAAVSTCILNHPVIDMGYKFKFGNKVVSYITDVELFNEDYFYFVSKSMKKKSIEINRILFNDLTKQLERFIRNSDVLIIDSFCSITEYPNKLGWGHSCYEDSFELACKNNIKKLYFFHHDPNKTDEQLADIEQSFKKRNKKHRKLKSVNVAREKDAVKL